VSGLARNWLLLSIVDGLPHLRLPLRDDLISPAPLRDYQFDLLYRAAAAMRAGHRRVLLQLPTGGGKTEMAKAAARSAVEQAMRAHFLVHRKELIDQTSRSFWRSHLAHGFVATGRPFDPEASALLAGIQTLVNRLDQVPPPNLAIIDEAHHATAATWSQALDWYGDNDAYVLGLTATPERLDGAGLDGHFDTLICGPSVAELIADGYLSEFNYYAPSIPDLKGIKTTAGDFARGEVADLMDKPKLVGDIVDHYLQLAPGAPGIFFAASIAHSQHIAAAFNAAGVPAAHVDGSSKDRDSIVDRFRAGELKMMTNVDLFGEGFDVPGIVYCGLGRPTKSLSLFMQQCGRAFRPIYAEGLPLDTREQRFAAIAAGRKAGGAIICDHAGNAFRHGLPDDEREWSLAGKAGRKSEGSVSDDAMPVRQCLVCYRVSPSTLSICPGCESEFPRQERKMAHEAGQLTKLERDQLRKDESLRKQREEKACRNHEDFVQLARDRGYEDPEAWASVRIKARATARRKWSRR